MSGGCLIVGAGQAGLQIALSLREQGDDGPITICGAEDHLPYQRPPLSKAYLKGDVDRDALLLRKASYLDKVGIRVLPARRICSIELDPAAPASWSTGSGTASTRDGFTTSFNRLALAVGARVRRLNVAGADLDGVCYIRGIADADQLRRRLPEARQVVVIGGGFIGLEAAAVMRERGLAVVVIEGAERLIARAVAPVVSEFYFQAHRRRGVDVRLGTTVAGFDGIAGRVQQVRLSDGSCLPADLVVVGIGIQARTELAESIGLRCDRGVVVDACARTSNPAIVAAGDCTAMSHPRGQDGTLRLESVQSAVDQAKCAAMTLAGHPQPYDAVPWFWSDQGSLKLQIAGISAGFDQAVVRGDPTLEAFSVVYFRGQQLIAVDAVNRPQDYLAVRRALQRGQNLRIDQIADVGIALKDLTANDRVETTR